jgi:23S rRNA pseudouridine1911/1915/1917 synthase
MNNNSIKLFINQNDVGERIDVLLTKKIDDLTRSNIKKIIESGEVAINGREILSPSKKLKLNDVVVLVRKKSEIKKIKPFKINLEIIFEDKDLLVINKPAGMVVHPGAGNYDHTLVNALVYKYRNKLSDVNGSLRPGIVHRIDKETSGLLVVAKNNLSHSNLGKQFSEHSIIRKYLALVWGVVRPLNGKIKTLISRSKKNRQLMTVSEFNGKKAITNYKTLDVFNIKDVPKISLIECELETGRTHQIRVHMKYKGASLLGDKQYGKKNIKFKKINEDFNKKLLLLNGQALHAKTLGFKHPVNNDLLTFNSKLPKDFNKLLSLLKKLSG